ncbi:MAG: MBL fold metallo-hydrolase [Candidatus Heimdallarchaeota archaeon]|nr:MBL fold metallo-hydrolase [Candidatus Heimdallarchaeota archaeon]MCG3255409.1 MBL fold metallo-hydrolase [Candidatus Heimdallarchaeota archaeon]MCK4610482.1 MBL fold metallo-hydrolase [Candidatus Heimdallarchaeota archaeon]
MKVQKVGSRGYVFTFKDPYKLNIYVINGEEHIFICDTGFGSDSVNELLDYLRTIDIHSKPFIVFNSHADYDHVWGNHVFKESEIIAHELSPEIFQKEGEEILEKYAEHKRGEVVLTPPNKLFKEKIVFDVEGVEFYHSPGHTLESSSCFDHKEKILFVGDNIESPFPYINFLNLENYCNSLREYLTRNAKIIISGHDEVMFDETLIQENLQYLETIQSRKIDRKNFTKQHRGIHFQNVSRLAELFKEKGDKITARRYYKEALEIQIEAETSPENEARVKEIEEIIADLA